MRREKNMKKITKDIENLNRAFLEGRVMMFDIYRELDSDALQNMKINWAYGPGRFLYEDANHKAETTMGIRPARRLSCIRSIWHEQCEYCRGLLHMSRKELDAVGFCRHRIYDGDPMYNQVEEHIIYVRKEFDKKYLRLRRRGVSVSEIMNSLIWENMPGKPDKETATEHVMNRSELDFELYDVVNDCINPITGKPLVNFMDPTLERFYAFRNNDIDYDADASLEANIIYEKIFPFMNWMDKKVIRPQSEFNGYGLKFELGEAGCTGGLSYRGDTMNSVATTNRAYYWEHKEMHGREFIWPKEALTLMDVYHTPGNFMVLPYRKGLSVNQVRGTGESKDYFDLFLLAIYNFFLKANGMEGDDSVSLAYILKYDGKLVRFMTVYLSAFIELDKKRFSEHDCQFIDDIADTSMLISNVLPGWEAFVEENLLHDFVEPNEYGHFGRPKELWKNHFTTYNKCYGQPYREEQFVEFWTNAAEWIQRRSKRIYHALHNDL